MTTSAAARSFEEVVTKIANDGERVVLERNGAPVVALVSIEDLELLEQLEDEADVREATRVLREMEESGEAPISLNEMKRSLGL